MKLNSELAKLGINPEIVGVSLFLVTCAGVALASLGNFQSWAVYEKCEQRGIAGFTYNECNFEIRRTSEQAPEGFIKVRGLSSTMDVKSVGVMLALGCGFLSTILNGQINETLLAQEEEEHNYKTRDTKIKDFEAQLEDDVEKRGLKLHYALEAKRFEQLYAMPVSEEFQEQGERAIEFEKQEESDIINADKLLAWMLQKNITESSIRHLSSSSIYGVHREKAILQPLLEELVQAGAVQWLNEERTKFKLLMG